MIGIIGAMDVEVQNIKSLIKNNEIKTLSGVEFNHGYINNTEVVVAKCGIGKVAAAICAQTMILEYKVEKLINVGVAGNLSSNLNIGSIAISTSLVHHDLDTTSFGDPMGLISGLNIVNIMADEKMVEEAENAVKSLNINYEKGVIASGDQFISSKDKKEYIKKEFNAIACEMEGAAIAHVAYVNNVPFCVIRAISDNADGQADMDYPTFLKHAVKQSVEVIKTLIK